MIGQIGQQRGLMTETRILAVVLATLLMLGMLGTIQVARADEDTECDGLLPAGTYDNVVVLEAKSCEINGGVVITGNFQAQKADSIIIGGAGNSVGGNVEIQESTGTIEIKSLTVVGNIKVEKGTGGSDFVDLTNNKVTGNIDVIENESYDLIIVDFNVADNIKVEKNKATRINIQNNDALGNLECKENDAVPSGPGGNTALGELKDQCEDLD